MMVNVVLIGMTGVGKTTIGEALSKALDREFIDTDDLIKEKTGIEISKIFSLYGEEYFRNLESGVVNSIYKNEDLIISTGGGIVLYENNIIKLKEKGIIILLEASVETIASNIKKSNESRPLLNNEEDIFPRLKTLYENRKALYLSAANRIINVDNKLIDDIVYEIIEKCVRIKS